jgi:hypothetical protein
MPYFSPAVAVLPALPDQCSWSVPRQLGPRVY